MRPLHFMVDGLTDVMQQTHPPGQLHLEPQFGCHDSGQKPDFNRVLQYILCIARPKFELTNVFNQFAVHAMNTQVKGSLFAGLLNGNTDFFFNLFNDIFDPCRVNTTICNQFHER